LAIAAFPATSDAPLKDASSTPITVCISANVTCDDGFFVRNAVGVVAIGALVQPCHAAWLVVITHYFDYGIKIVVVLEDTVPVHAYPYPAAKDIALTVIPLQRAQQYDTALLLDW